MATLPFQLMITLATPSRLKTINNNNTSPDQINYLNGEKCYATVAQTLLHVKKCNTGSDHLSPGALRNIWMTSLRILVDVGKYGRPYIS